MTAVDRTNLSDLADIELRDEHGDPVPIGDLWRDRTAVLAFVRHFG